MVLDGRHRDIAQVALSAAGVKYGVAFAGGGALQIHNVSERATCDVDLFVRKAKDVRKAAEAIARALDRAGYVVDLITPAAEMWEFEVRPHDDPDADAVQLQVAYFSYTETVTFDVGPVVTLDYLAARKAVALMERHQVRDFVDIAQLVDHGYAIGELLKMAFAEAPYLTPEDAGDAGVHLDDVSDRRLERELPPGRNAEWVRKAFAGWPREPVHSD